MSPTVDCGCIRLTLYSRCSSGTTKLVLQADTIMNPIHYATAATPRRAWEAENRHKATLEIAAGSLTTASIQLFRSTACVAGPPPELSSEHRKDPQRLPRGIRNVLVRWLRRQRPVDRPRPLLDVSVTAFPTQWLTKHPVKQHE